MWEKGQRRGRKRGIRKEEVGKRNKEEDKGGRKGIDGRDVVEGVNRRERCDERSEKTESVVVVAVVVVAVTIAVAVAVNISGSHLCSDTSNTPKVPADVPTLNFLPS